MDTHTILLLLTCVPNEQPSIYDYDYYSITHTQTRTQARAHRSRAALCSHAHFYCRHLTSREAAARARCTCNLQTRAVLYTPTLIRFIVMPCKLEIGNGYAAQIILETLCKICLIIKSLLLVLYVPFFRPSSRAPCHPR